MKRTPPQPMHPGYKPQAPVLGQFSLAGKAVLVTGKCGPIDAAVARGLAEAGAHVAITYTTGDPTEAVAAIEAAIKDAQSAGSIRAYQYDPERDESAAEVVNTAARDFQDLLDSLGGEADSLPKRTGRLDVLVVNPSQADVDPYQRYTPGEGNDKYNFQRNGGYWEAHTAEVIFEHQVRAGQPRGNIIFTTSWIPEASETTTWKVNTYEKPRESMNKLVNLMSEKKSRILRVNCVHLGYLNIESFYKQREVDIDFFYETIHLGRVCDLAELKGVYVFLASDASGYMTGTHIRLDGGYTF